MALSYIEQKDFSGGINANNDHAMINRNELVDARDVLVDRPGIARRRGPFVALTTSYSSLPIKPITAPVSVYDHIPTAPVIFSGKHDYNKFSGGIFFIVQQPKSAPDTGYRVSLWYLPVANGGFEEPFRVLGPVHTDVAVQTGKVCPAITKVNKQDNNADSNVKYNRSIIACSAFSVVVLISRDSEVLAWSNKISTDPNETIEQQHTRSVHRRNSSRSYYLRVTSISAGRARPDTDDPSFGQSAYDDKLNIEKEMNSSQVRVNVSGEDWYHLTPILPNKEFTTCALVDGYAFLAGDPEFGQHFFWSAAEDSLNWEDADGPFFEHLPDDSASRVVGLTNLGSSLVVLKERSIFTVKIANGGPTDWVASQRAAIGTIDQRSVAQWREKLIFANRKGVYAFDGYDVQELSESISEIWEPIMANWSSSWFISGAVFEDYYLINILDSGGDLLDTFCLHLPSGAWVRFSGTRFTSMAWAPDERGLIGFHWPLSSTSSKPRFCDIGSMFKLASGSDALGSGPDVEMVLPRVINDDRFRSKVWRRVEVSYGASGSGALNVDFVTGTQSEGITWTPISALPNETDTKKRFRIGQRSRALGLRIHETGTLTSANITGVRIGLKPMRPSRDEGN